jgi:Fic family protein
MLDDNWDLVNGPEAHEIEVLNYSNQINVIDALVRMFAHHKPAHTPGGMLCPNNNILKEMHRTGTLFLLERPGEWRDSDVVVSNGGVVVHQPPGFAEVPNLMAEFEQEAGSRWAQETPVSVAAFTLWRINWIHPFKNGNGRTARAFAYACMCLKAGLLLPGSPTVIDLIMGSKAEFEAALREADANHQRGVADLTVLEAYVERLLIRQLSAIPVA